MQKGFIIGIIIAILLVLGILAYSINQNSYSSNQESSTSSEVSGTGSNVIEITSSGFSPKSLMIKKGESVTFVNRDSKPHWPASAFHPTHTAYPGSGIEKCGTSEQSTIFDACRGLEKGERFTFQFNEAGKWNYHDHLNPNSFGSITVE